MTVCPGFNSPERSAASITPSARRSFTEPSGLKASILANRLTPGGARRLIRTTGVFPTVSRMFWYLAILCPLGMTMRQYYLLFDGGISALRGRTRERRLDRRPLLVPRHDGFEMRPPAPLENAFQIFAASVEIAERADEIDILDAEHSRDESFGRGPFFEPVEAGM